MCHESRIAPVVRNLFQATTLAIKFSNRQIHRPKAFLKSLKIWRLSFRRVGDFHVPIDETTENWFDELPQRTSASHHLIISRGANNER